MINLRNEKSQFYKIGKVLVLTITITAIGLGIYTIVFRKQEWINVAYNIVISCTALHCAFFALYNLFAKKDKFHGVLLSLNSAACILILILKAVL